MNIEIEGDGSLVPDEFCTVTVTMNQARWRKLLKLVDNEDTQVLLAESTYARTPSLSLIGEALQRKCKRCDGTGLELRNTDSMYVKCRECGGSGHASVPGARLVSTLETT